ncbi:hypothetical protein PUNSTDRAFT_135616 [Punctularia strigosozonata HHB-11173 SS5]|uniref:uncharacterized protein n=1 Tax=Punctularia strigosozonata (strain HHB-11173) TaxID=741275 RepID=UPI00044172E1|nr:uncharacterized protein PUNSTDRAFT_135616 [Punctularia strigosozonata HHB-11173 SS5]EIN08101.1 hypothetical protein PUNSTDRAFT_135616 [Punctularia strigosozonata HHB-11173 SS5]
MCSPPNPNTDVSGIGVRISFYLQSVLLSLLAARSASADEITDALSTLIITNLALCVTTMVQSLEDQLALYDGLMVCYLLTGSWFAIFFALPQYNRYKKSDKWVKLLAVGQSYVVFVTVLSIFGTSPVFGNDHECNDRRSVVIFAPFDAVTKGRIAGLALYGALALFYTILVWNDYNHTATLKRALRSARNGEMKARILRKIPTSRARNLDPPMPEVPMVNVQSASTSNLGNAIYGYPSLGNGGPHPGRSRASSKTSYGSGTAPRQRHPLAPDPPQVPTPTSKKDRKPKRNDNSNPEYRPNVDGRVILNLTLIVTASAIAIVNTELFRHFNHPDDADRDWGFGQILPMFLVVLPAQRTLRVFWEQRLGPKRNQEKAGTKRVRVKRHLAPSVPGSASSPGAFDFMSMPSIGGPTGGGVSAGLSDFGMLSGMFGGGGGPHGIPRPDPHGGARIEEVEDDEDEEGGDYREYHEPAPPVTMPVPVPQTYAGHSSEAVSTAGSSVAPGTAAWAEARAGNETKV